MAKISVFGTGAWGTALANVCARAGHAVKLWGRNAQVVAAMERDRENVRRLPGVILEPGVACVSDFKRALAADVYLVAVPAQSFRSFLSEVADGASLSAPLVICAKEIERSTHALMSAVAQEIVPRCPPAVLSGPSFAHDVARGLPTAVTLAAEENALAERLAALLSGPRFRLYNSTDVVGVEIGGAAKNVLAIACGIAHGRALGASAQAALIARGFAEIRRFGAACGARAETLMGLSGLGDVVLTCSSAQSRNFSLGVKLGLGVVLAEALRAELAEGAFTAPALVEKARGLGVEMPIAEAVALILSEQIDVGSAIESLLARPLKSEL